MKLIEGKITDCVLKINKKDKNQIKKLIVMYKIKDNEVVKLSWSKGRLLKILCE